MDYYGEVDWNASPAWYEYGHHDPLCNRCREREKDREENSRSILCAQCRQECIKLRIPIGIKVFLALLCAVFALSVVSFPAALRSYKGYRAAEAHMAAGEYALAYREYAPLLERYRESVPMILKAAEAAMGAQYFVELDYTLDTYLVGKSLDERQYSRAMHYSGILEAYGSTYEAIDGIFTELSTASPTNAEELIPLLQSRLEELLARPELDKTLIYYNMGLYNTDEEQALHYLALACEDERFTYPHSFYGNALRRADRTEEAEQVYREALDRNASDAFSLRGISILRLLEGQREEALELMRIAYAIEPYGLYMPDALLVALWENDMQEEARELLSALTEEGFVVPLDLQQYLDGEISLREFYMS